MNRFLVFPGLLRCVAVSRIMVITTLLWSANGNTASGDWLTLYPTEVEALFSYDRLDRSSSDNSSSVNTDKEFGVSIAQEGYVLDPDIAWFQFSIMPSFTLEETQSTTMTDEKSGEDLDYLLQVSLLRETIVPLGIDFLVQRSASQITGNLGSRYDNIINTKQASIDWKIEAFPMSLSIKEESFEQEFQNSLNSQVSKRDEILQGWVIRGASSKLGLRLEHKTLDDRIITRDNDYQQNQAKVNHRLSWGKGSQLLSRFDYFDRNGFNANERQTFEEIARIQHTDNTYSRTSYRYFSLIQNIETVEQLGKFELNHQLYKNLTTIASLEVDSSHSESLDEISRTADLDSRYYKQELFGAAVNAGVGVSYGRTDRDRDSATSQIDVSNESHVIPLSGAVILKTRFIRTSSIIVTDSDGTLVFDEGLDYEVHDLVGDLTELRINFGGQINVGDTILVSYQADSLPSQEFSTLQTRYNFGIDLGWLQFSHSDNKSDDRLLSGAGESFLNDTRLTSTDIEFRWDLNNIDILLGAERRFILSGGFESTTYTYRQTFSWIYSSDSRWNLNTTESFTQQDNRENNLYSLDLSLDWRPLSSLSVRPTLGFWKRQTTEDTTGSSNDDEFITAGFRLLWNYRQVVMNFSYYRNQRTIQTDPAAAETQSDEDRIMFKLVRRF